ncbi:hypothetical protein R1flu_023559 [Riccia fluitans]|uniref:Translocon-associated protein subunit alpha n=1 Tax=Riccia fluitans TaxID=41844 RepID=A0ABD1XSD1_9MARC
MANLKAVCHPFGLAISYLLVLTHALDQTLANSLSIVDLSTFEVRSLRLGEERKQDRLPLRGGGGKCVYELLDLKESFSYEVKISYPASIPSRFSLSLAKARSTGNKFLRRRLLDTEKVIFSVDRENDVEIPPEEGGFEVLMLVTVEPAGVVGQADMEEQAFVVYNIMLEEVRFGGIPVQAFWVGFLGLVAISLSALAVQVFPFPPETERNRLKHSKQATS